MTIRGTTRLLGILGNPLTHSWSPAMHNAALEALGLDYAYVPLPARAEDLPGLLNALKAVNFAGVNVTLPHKQAVLPLLDELSDISQKMGAVNTIVNRDGKLYGTTTDPVGFLRGFAEAGHSFAGKSVLVLGNGGSARTIAFALFLLESPSRVAVAARDARKSELLAEEIAAKTGSTLERLSLENLADAIGAFDILVNTTPLGMHPDVELTPLREEWIRPAQIVYDIIYNPEETSLLRAAKARGAQAVGGLGMLVHQGLASFKLWTGVEPDPALFYSGIRRQQSRSGKAQA